MIFCTKSVWIAVGGARFIFQRWKRAEVRWLKIQDWVAGVSNRWLLDSAINVVGLTKNSTTQRIHGLNVV